MIQQVGKYVLESELGKGAMGSVWLSRHPGLDIPVAVKILDPALAAEDPDYMDRFIKEGKLAASINHQNVVRIIDAGQDGPIFYLVMELVDGADAKQLVEHRGALPVDEVIELAICTAEALREAHSKGIVHRDIKPDNILVTSDGKIKVADLGIAKQLNDDYGTTMAGTTIGTPYYIAPEQAMDSSTVDCRCDIYALGGTLYHLLTGTVPFTGPSAMAILMKHSQEELQNPKERRPDLPDSICHVVCKMMEKHPDDRYQNCDEVLRDLKAVKNHKNSNASKKKKHIKAPSKKRMTINNLDKDLVDLPQSSKSSKRSASKKKKKAPIHPALIGVLCLIPVMVIILLFLPNKDKKQTVLTPTEKKESTASKVQENKSPSIINSFSEGDHTNENLKSIKIIGRRAPQYLSEEKSKQIMWYKNWTIFTEFKGTRGTIVSKTIKKNWVKYSKAIYIDKNGQLVYDIGMVDSIKSSTNVNDEKYHKALLICKNGKVNFYIDGELKASKTLSAESGKGFLFKVGTGASSFHFNGHIKRVAFWNRFVPSSLLKSYQEGIFDPNKTAYYFEHQLKDQAHSSSSPIEKIYNGIVKNNPEVKFSKSRIQIGDKGVKLDLNNLKIHDISSLKGLPIIALKLYGTRINDHSPLKGLPLVELDLTLSKTPVSLKHLNYKTLKNLHLTAVNLEDLNEFSKFNLNYLGVKQHPFLLNYIKHMALHRLDLDSATLQVAFEKLNTKNLVQLRLYMAKGVKDISTLKGAKLKVFHLTESPCKNIDILKGMPLDDVALIGTAVEDASVLKHTPVRSLIISHHEKNIDYIHTLKRLQKVAIPFRHWTKELEVYRNSNILIEGYNRRDTHWWLTWGQIRVQDSKEFWKKYDKHIRSKK